MHGKYQIYIYHVVVSTYVQNKIRYIVQYSFYTDFILCLVLVQPRKTGKRPDMI